MTGLAANERSNPRSAGTGWQSANSKPTATAFTAEVAEDAKET